MSKVAKKKTEEETKLALSNYGDDFDAGFEDEDQDEIQIPYLHLLQSNSKLAEGKEFEVEGAKAGLMINTVTHQIYGAELVIIPAARKVYVMEAIHPDFGRGIIGRHATDSPLWLDAIAKHGGSMGKIPHPSDKEHVLIKTVDLFSIMEVGEELEPIIVSWSVSKMRPYKKLYNCMKSCTIPVPGEPGKKKKAPIFSHRFRLTTRKEPGKSDPYWNFAVTPANGSVRETIMAEDDPRFRAAKEFRELVTSGKAVAAEQETDESTQSSSNNDGGGAY